MVKLLKFQSCLTLLAAASLSFGAEKTKPKPTAKIKTFQLKKDVIESDLPEAERLKEIAASVGEVELQVDQLSAEVQKTKQKLIEDANINNSVRIEVQLAIGSDDASIRQMQVKLDGYEVYSINDSAGLWIPTSVVPIYAGPLPPGDHNIEIDATMTLKDKDKLPLHSRQNRNLKQALTINVPEGQINKKWRIELQPAKTNETPSTATLKTDEAT